MKNIKLYLLFLIFMLLINPVFAKTDRYSEDYLKGKKHFSVITPIAEAVVQKAICSSLSKETEGKYKVKFTAYTASSMKRGIFKYLEIVGNDIKPDGVEIPYVKLETESDYNWIDYTQSPVVFKSDMIFKSETFLNENTINQALQTKEYKEKLQKVNQYAYPLFVINNVKIKIKNSKVYIIMEYNFPIAPMSKNRTFMVSSGFKISNEKVTACNVAIDSAYGNLPLEKVKNLINLLDPLSFTMNLFDTGKCDCKIEKIEAQDDILKINGRIYIKGDNK